MLNLIHAKTFLAIIDAGGLRPAARHLAIAPSTALQHIRQLEQELGAPLLERRRGAFCPTAQGAIFLPLARSLIATAERAKDVMTKSSLRIAAASNVGTYLLQNLLASFRAGTGSEVSLWIGANPVVSDHLQRGQADVAILERWNDVSGFEAHVWRHEPLVVIADPRHPFAQRKTISPDDLIGQRILGGESGTGTGMLLRRALGKVAVKLQTIDGYSNTEAVKRAVRAGEGISIVMRSAVADEVASGTLVGLSLKDVPLIKPIRIALPASTPTTSPARQFLAHALEQRPAFA